MQYNTKHPFSVVNSGLRINRISLKMSSIMENVIEFEFELLIESKINII